MPYCVFPNAKKLRVQTKHHIGQTKMNACGSNFTELSTLLITTWKCLSPNARSLCQVLLDLHPALLFSSYGYYQRSRLSTVVPLSVNQKRPWFRERTSVKTGLEIRWKPGLEAQHLSTTLLWQLYHPLSLSLLFCKRIGDQSSWQRRQLCKSFQCLAWWGLNIYKSLLSAQYRVCCVEHI